MIRTFPIEFIRQIFEQTLFEESEKNTALFGGDNELKIFSFYEQLSKQEEVDRYVETYRQLTEQQNRTGLIGLGTITAPSNPSITNLNKGTIIPLEYVLTMRTTLANRDEMLESLYNLIETLKGTKVDIAEFDNGKIMKVGTIGVNKNYPQIKSGDYIGLKDDDETLLDTFISNKITDLTTNKKVRSDDLDSATLKYLYFSVLENGKEKLRVAVKENGVWTEKVDDGSYDSIVFPPEHKSFSKWQVSISFESINCDEPYTLNSEEYITISFGGSATITNANILLGNSLAKIGIQRLKVVSTPDIEFTDDIHILDALEMPSGNNLNTMLNQLKSNNFITNSHADAMNLSIQYTFVCDTDDSLLNAWFIMGRYGIFNPRTTTSPNMIYTCYEWWSCWGNVALYEYLGKIVEDIKIENSESDVLTLTLSFQVQGANN